MKGIERTSLTTENDENAENQPHDHDASGAPTAR